MLRRYDNVKKVSSEKERKKKSLIKVCYKKTLTNIWRKDYNPSILTLEWSAHNMLIKISKNGATQTYYKKPYQQKHSCRSLLLKNRINYYSYQARPKAIINI